jgi:hypothetical protein
MSVRAGGKHPFGGLLYGMVIQNNFFNSREASPMSDHFLLEAEPLPISRLSTGLGSKSIEGSGSGGALSDRCEEGHCYDTLKSHNTRLLLNFLRIATIAF